MVKMKKECTFIVLMAIVVLVIMSIGICIGEAQSEKIRKMERVNSILERTSEQTGYVNLGVIDGSEISKRNGMLYDGPAIREELFSRAGLKVPENSWAFGIGEYDGIYLVRFVEYETDPQRNSVVGQKVKNTYIYGVY